MNLRPYLPTDRAACLGVFNSNVPEYFDPVERTGFEAFLDHPECRYFVMEHDDALLGCGGYAVAQQEGLASLVWGMIGRDSHKRGLGRFLLLYRLREIGKAGGIQVVRLDTSQKAEPFFRKQGFKATGVIKNGYGLGLDRVEMVMKLTVCP
jgi:N-acetylglutamate synthase-like GNAT family acetyltransferase